VDLAASAGGLQQLTVAAAQARLADLAVGQLYRVQITDVFPGKAEFLLGNQYLLATTPFKFQVGDNVTLRLVGLTPQLLTFQLTLPGGQAGQADADLAMLLRAANMPDTADNRAALSQLVLAGIPVSNRSMGEMVQLLSTVPQEAIAAFLPLYKELIERGMHPAPEVLRQLALMSTGTPELSALLSTALTKLRGQRTSRRGGQGALDDAVEAALTAVEREEDLPTMQALKDKLRLLYGSPEKALRELLMELSAEDAASGKTKHARERPSAHVELGDLANIALSQHVPAELAAALNILQALRIENALARDAMEFALPLTIDGEPTDVQVSISVLAEQYYQKDYALRIRVENRTQGAVEFQLRTRGPGLSIDILAEHEETLAAYEQQLARFEEEIADGTGYFVRRAKVAHQSL
jgi:hypothetical protein